MRIFHIFNVNSLRWSGERRIKERGKKRILAVQDLMRYGCCISMLFLANRIRTTGAESPLGYDDLSLSLYKSSRPYEKRIIPSSFSTDGISRARLTTETFASLAQMHGARLSLESPSSVENLDQNTVTCNLDNFIFLTKFTNFPISNTIFHNFLLLDFCIHVTLDIHLIYDIHMRHSLWILPLFLSTLADLTHNWLHCGTT